MIEKRKAFELVVEYCNNYSINVCMICRYFNDVLFLVLLHCGLCNESCYGKCVRHLDVRITEYIGESPTIKKKVKLRDSSVRNNFLFFSH